ncbi:proline-serine-threonine phosphatase-interacting protein 2 isoform X2 [Antennarius striatus]|uniref:proline-serine-threonine phosphatase-interacting protein 2 isoform X2 n=1 Tax=Antennarius striatus TaxID=241820 RepID=UPI0035AF2986
MEMRGSKHPFTRRVCYRGVIVFTSEETSDWSRFGQSSRDGCRFQETCLRFGMAAEFCFYHLQNSDLTSTAGYDAIVQYLNDGRRTCKEVEEFMKARASVEERYAKDLLSLSRKVCGHNETNTLKKSLDVFKLQTEHVSLSHLQLARCMREEAKKLEEFREKQKEARRKVEQQMEALHKQKSSQVKRTMEAKKTYEQKVREKEEADQKVIRNTSSTKNTERLHAKAQQATQNAEEADRWYHQSVSILGRTREEWLREHMTTCETFEKQATDRIDFLRNAIWTHLNQLSQQCVTSDELYEEVRKSLEQCDVQEDIEHFITLKNTGDRPPAPVAYEKLSSGQRSRAVAPPPRLPPPITRRPASPPMTSSGEPSAPQDAAYSVIHF